MTRVQALRSGTVRFGSIAAGLLSTIFVWPAVVLLAAEAASEHPNAAARPNILVIITDQQHAGMLSCAGNRFLKTPAADSLAQTGVRFERSYCANPVCLPSRFSMMTGRYPSAIGVRHNGSKPTADVDKMPELALGCLFRNAGYETAYGGKVHLPGPMGNVARCGFDVISRNEREELAAACAEFLGRKHERPFLLVGSFINPHDICYMAIRDHDAGSPLGRNAPSPLFEAMQPPAGVSPEEFVERHCPPLPENFEVPEGESEAIGDLLRLRPFRMHARENWSAQQWRIHRWAYCRLTERVDAEIGRVLEALRNAGLEDDTLVVLTSDHGDMDSAHRMEHKTVFYEEAARVPLILSFKGRTAAGRVDRTHLVCNGLDLIPTLCDYAGIEPPEDLQGKSLRPLAEGKTVDAWREDLLVENQIGYMVHTGRYKYAFYDSGARREMLLDLQTDPGEMKNLAGDPAYQEILRDLRRRLAEQLDRAGVDASVPQ